MASSKTKAGSPLQSTRQMLDELDSLMERMLALPVGDVDDLPPLPRDVPNPPALTAVLTQVPGEESGAKGQESGVRSQESGVRSQETGVRGQETGARGQESGARGQESGVRGQESGVRGQESGGRPAVRNQQSGVGGQKSKGRNQKSWGKGQPSAARSHARKTRASARAGGRSRLSKMRNQRRGIKNQRPSYYKDGANQRLNPSPRFHNEASGTNSPCRMIGRLLRNLMLRRRHFGRNCPLRNRKLGGRGRRSAMRRHPSRSRCRNRLPLELSPLCRRPPRVRRRPACWGDCLCCRWSFSINFLTSAPSCWDRSAADCAGNGAGTSWGSSGCSVWDWPGPGSFLIKYRDVDNEVLLRGSCFPKASA